MRVAIDPERCVGHGRCFSLAPELFASDELGQGVVLGDGHVPSSALESARLAEANCPEYAVALLEEA
jgi:ferredoxin